MAYVVSNTCQRLAEGCGIPTVGDHTRCPHSPARLYILLHDLGPMETEVLGHANSHTGSSPRCRHGCIGRSRVTVAIHPQNKQSLYIRQRGSRHHVFGAHHARNGETHRLQSSRWCISLSGSDAADSIEQDGCWVGVREKFGFCDDGEHRREAIEVTIDEAFDYIAFDTVFWDFG